MNTKLIKRIEQLEQSLKPKIEPMTFAESWAMPKKLHNLTSEIWDRWYGGDIIYNEDGTEKHVLDYPEVREWLTDYRSKHRL